MKRYRDEEIRSPYLRQPRARTSQGQTDAVTRWIERYSDSPAGQVERRRQELMELRDGVGVTPEEYHELAGINAAIARRRIERWGSA